MATNLVHDFSAYTTSKQTSTITLVSLATGSVRQGTEFDFSASPSPTDWALSLKLLLGTGTVTGQVNVYLCALAPNGTDYADGATSSDASFTAANIRNAKLVASVNVGSAATSIDVETSLRRLFSTMPKKAVPLVQNSTGVAFGTGGTNFELSIGPVSTGTP
jgi:hypothetical protein